MPGVLFFVGSAAAASTEQVDGGTQFEKRIV
jgi:hypothetical protein